MYRAKITHNDGTEEIFDCLSYRYSEDDGTMRLYLPVKEINCPYIVKVINDMAKAEFGIKGIRIEDNIKDEVFFTRYVDTRKYRYRVVNGFCPAIIERLRINKIRRPYNEQIWETVSILYFPEKIV